MTKHHKKCSVKDNLKVCHDLDVKGNSKLEGNVKIGGDLTVRKDLIVKGTTTLAGDITPVSGTFSPGTDRFQTIQSIFDFLEGKAVDNVLIDLLAPPSGVKTYTENLFVSGIISVPSQGYAMPLDQYPLQNIDEFTLINPGLSLRGDPRYCAGMNYIDGAQLNYFNDPNATNTGYIRKLGTPYGYVDLVRPSAGNIQVVITSAPLFDPENNFGNAGILEQPNFPVEDVVPGDHILIRDDTGVWAEFIITTVAGNIISYNGDVTALGPTAELILLPRVCITSDYCPGH